MLMSCKKVIQKTSAELSDTAEENQKSTEKKPEPSKDSWNVGCGVAQSGCTVFCFSSGSTGVTDFLLCFPYHFCIGWLNHACTDKVYFNGNTLFPVFVLVAVKDFDF